MPIFLDNLPWKKHQRFQIIIVESIWSESALNLEEDLFFLEPVQPRWMSSHKSQACFMTMLTIHC